MTSGAAAVWLALTLLLVGCGDLARLPVAAGTGPGPEPELPPPRRSVLPTVNIAPAVGWPPGAQPQGAFGTEVKPFATGLDHPRWLLVLANGDVLVADDVGNVIWRVGAAI